MLEEPLRAHAAAERSCSDCSMRTRIADAVTEWDNP
jgi:hypothetical protein